MTGDGPYAWMVGRRFEAALDRIGYDRKRLKLRTDLFAKSAPDNAQLALF